MNIRNIHYSHPGRLISNGVKLFNQIKGLIGKRLRLRDSLRHSSIGCVFLRRTFSDNRNEQRNPTTYDERRDRSHLRFFSSPRSPGPRIPQSRITGLPDNRSPITRFSASHLLLSLAIALASLFLLKPSALFAEELTATFNYTGTYSAWDVPVGVTSIQVDATGAQGTTGRVRNCGVGNGARVQTTLSVTPAETLYIYVGGGNGYNGGGAGGVNTGGNGGGASDIRRTPYDLDDRVIVAGGGGGAGGEATAGWGGAGGGAGEIGDDAGPCYDDWNGKGGTGSAGGAGGGTGGAGDLGIGGAGGNNTPEQYGGGGGGGGGYYGGGGGGSASGQQAGGGGGASSYSAGTDTTYTSGGIDGPGTGYNAGGENGQIIITYVKYAPGAVATKTYQPSTKDTKVWAEAAYKNINYGTDEVIKIEYTSSNQTRGLFHFDISDIGDSAIFSQGDLSLYCFQVDDPIAKTFYANRLTQIGWVETEATWVIYSTGNNWATGGGDFTTTNRVGISIGDIGWKTWSSSSLIQDCYDNQNKNVHLLIHGVYVGQGKYFYSKDYTTDTYLRPKLTVTYQVLPHTLYSNNDSPGAQSGDTNPTGITDTTPVFSAIYSDPDGDPSSAYELQVNTASDFAAGTMVADSGKTSLVTISGNRTVDLPYPSTNCETQNFYAGAGDGVANHKIEGQPSQANWDSCHDVATSDFANYTNTFTAHWSYIWGDTDETFIYRSFYPIDTSGLPDNATISAAVLKLYYKWKVDSYNGDGYDYVAVVKTFQASTSEIIAADYKDCGYDSGNETGGRAKYPSVKGSSDVDITGITADAYNDFTLNATGRGWISKTGITKLGVREGHDLEDYFPGDPGAAHNGSGAEFRSSEQTDQEPYLAVTFVDPDNPASADPYPLPLDGDQYWWRIKFWDSDDLEGEWSTETAHFTMATNQTPNVPEDLAQTADGTTLSWGSWTNHNTPELSFSLSDPDAGDIIRYHVQIDDDSDFSTPVKNVTEGTGDTTPRGFVQYTDTLTDSYSYYWKVSCIDDDSAESTYSVANSGDVAFRIDTAAPALIPTLASAHTENVWTNDNDVTVTWTDVDDPLSGTQGYRLKSDTTSTTVPVEGDDNVAQTIQTKDYIDVSDGDSNYIHIATRDNATNISATADHYGPLKIDTVAPALIPTLASAHTENVWTNDNDVTVTWTDVDDPLSGTQGYRLKSDTTSDTVPAEGDDNVAQTIQTKTYTDVGDGDSRYIHIATRDNATNISATADHFGPLKIDTAAPSTPGAPTISDITVTTSSMTVTSATSIDAGSGLHATTPYAFDETTSGITLDRDWGDSTYEVSGLSANTNYTFCSRARDTFDQASGYGATITKCTWANPPASATHTANSTSSISWFWVSGGAEEAFSAWTTDPVATTGWTTDTSWNQSSGLSANTPYTSYVKAKNKDDVATSIVNHSAYTSIETPNAPTFGTVSKDSIILNTSGLSNIASGSSGVYFNAITSGGDGGINEWVEGNTTDTATGLSANTPYTFQVKARNGDGDETGWSSDSAPKYTHANVPSSLGVTGDWDTTNSYHCDLSWTGDGDAYYIQYKTDDDPTWRNCGGSDWQTTGTTYVFKKLDDGSSDLSPDTTYYLQVKARNGELEPTNFSSSKSDSTPTDNPTISSISLSQVGEKDDTKIQISYTLSDVPEDSCSLQVQWSTSADSGWTSATLSGTTSSIASSALGTAHSDLYWNCGNIGSAYYVRVRAHDGSDWGEWLTSGAIEIKQPKYDVGSSLGKCFIATAAFGNQGIGESENGRIGDSHRFTVSPDHPVNILKKFRDECLLTNVPGRAFVRFYYRHSPPIAEFIRDKEPLKAIVRTGLRPIVWGAKRILKE